MPWIKWTTNPRLQGPATLLALVLVVTLVLVLTPGAYQALNALTSPIADQPEPEPQEQVSSGPPVEPCPGGEPDSGVDPEPEPGQEPNPDPESDQEPQPDPGQEPEADPGQEPQPDAGPPPDGIDPALAAKYSQEPVISMHIHETGETVWLPLEEYVAGVVAVEIGYASPLAATEAQALATRTSLMNVLIEGGKAREIHGTDVCDSPKHSPHYRPQWVNDLVREAVRNTRGKIITHGDRPIRAFYSSCSGGATASYEESFPTNIQPPYIKVVESPCTQVEWEAEVSKDKLRQLAGWDEAGPVDTVKILEKGPSGRATKIQIGNAFIHGVDLRNGIDRALIKSTLITRVEMSADTVTFFGRGYGHGVGFDQKGSRELAKQGMGGEDIIHHYFKDVEIPQLWK